MSRSTLPAALLAACAVALGGCGDDDVFRTERPILRLTLDEYRIVPQNVSIETGRMKFTVRNTGRLTHNLVVQIAEGPDGKPVELARMGTMQPGATGEPIKVDLRPGEYRLVCTIANHDDLGQYGTLEVQE
ncbi:MAG TPA: plastocyanin/azurin family copper-binding protein [Solirubrobacteraceae bacterium]|nr:plastocyanin/azurin family copper-binding protein [Solirubrobacteraceae bacterium]